MKRKIISIDEEKCTGCGQCIPDCPEGALRIIEGKARLVSDLFCDGLGACIGTCPEGAISVIEREAGAYDENAVMEKIVSQGVAVITAHLEHLTSHREGELYHQALAYLHDHRIAVPPHKKPFVHHGSSSGPSPGCPGSAARPIPRADTPTRGEPDSPASSELRQWPVQLALLYPDAAYFDDADLLIAADCTPFAYAGFHRELLAGKILIIFCPKLDADIPGYIQKLAEILSRHRIRSATLVHMEVPCCSGIAQVWAAAMNQAGVRVPVTDVTITIQGEIQQQG